MSRETITPAIPSPKLDVVKAAVAMKEIHEVREGLRGDPLDRFVSVRDMLTDDAILKRLDARYYTESEVAVIGADYVWRDGTKALTANWDAGGFKITAQQLAADIAIGTAPLIITSTTKVINLNVDRVDGQHRALTINADHTHQSVGAQGGKLDHGLALNGVTSDQHHAQAHKDEHDPQTGGDPLDCAAAGEIVGVAAAAEGNADTLARSNHTHQIQHSIADNHLVTVDGGANQPVNTDYAAFTANGLEGRDKTQMLTFLNVADGAGVVDFAAVNAALAAANADINVNGQDIENIGQLAIGFTSPAHELESRDTAGHTTWSQRVYSDTLDHRPHLYFMKSHSDTPWTTAQTLNNEFLGNMEWLGVSNVPGFVTAAKIYVQQDGAAGAGVPAEMIFAVGTNAGIADTMTLTATELLLANGVNIGSPDADETHYLGRAVLGWTGAGNEASLQHRALAIDGTNYAIKQLNLGNTYLNCADTKNIFFRRNNVSVTNLDELDDLTDGGETALHTHAAGSLTFAQVNAALALANAAIDINSQNLTSVGTIGCGAITSGNIIIPDAGNIGSVSDTDAIAISAVGILGFSGQSAARAYLAGNQTITTGTPTKVHLVTENYDVQGEFVPWDVGDDANTGRFVVTVAGKYIITGIPELAGIDDGEYIVASIYVNGSQVTTTKSLSCVNGSSMYSSVTDILDLAVDDYIELYVQHNHGSDRTAQGPYSQFNFMAVHKIA